ncbi:30S ribosomal protein S5 [Candidatus Dojkabacteria bacterium]|nr:30S ribosomal protein S5 [Candidatus Dojkabacteria bacterium]
MPEQRRNQRINRGSRDRKKGRDNRRRQREGEFERKLIKLRRVAKVRAGAKRLRFSAVVAVGDRKGRVGVALGRGVDPRSALEKATKRASSDVVRVDLIGDTIPHEVYAKYRASKLIIKPAGPGTGVIASNAVRSVLELAGVRNVLSKQLGSRNPITNAYCAFKALKMLDKTRIIERKSKNLKRKLDNSKKDGASRAKKEKK